MEKDKSTPTKDELNNIITWREQKDLSMNKHDFQTMKQKKDGWYTSGVNKGRRRANLWNRF